MLYLQKLIIISPANRNTQTLPAIMKNVISIIAFLTSSLFFSQNNSEIVDVVNNGKIQTDENRQSQNYIASYLTKFFSDNYDRSNGFYLVVEQKTTNNESILKIEDKAFLNSQDIKAITLIGNGNKNPSVNFEFKKKGTEKLKEIAKKNIGNGIALIVDGKIITMPMISEEISDGKINYNSVLPYDETEKITKKLK